MDLELRIKSYVFYVPFVAKTLQSLFLCALVPS